MIVKALGIMLSRETYEDKSGNTVVNTVVACGATTYNCRGDVEAGIKKLDPVIIMGNLKIFPKGSFFSDERVRKATPQEVEEFGAFETEDTE